MKTKNLFTVLLAVLLYNLGCGQDKEKYFELVQEAQNSYDSKDYKTSAEKYKAAFDQLDGTAYPNDRYNAACSYALAGDTENSYYHLFYLAEHPKVKFRSLEHISTDTDLNSLHDDQRWNKLLATVETNKKEFEKDFDQPLIAELDTIFESDQSYRIQIEEIEEKYGQDSDEIKAHWELIRVTDSINLVKVKKILDERGWLGPKVIGNRGSSTLFLVIQHADLETQKKYLPMMREAVKNDNASPASLAMLEDRVALGQGQRQIYGSQIGRDPATGEYYVSPLIKPEKVNDRRAEVGLGTIEDYVQNWGMTWDLEKHKEQTKKIESESHK